MGRGEEGKKRKVKRSVKRVKLETGLWERGERYEGLTEYRAICISISCSSTKLRRQPFFFSHFSLFDYCSFIPTWLLLVPARHSLLL